MKFEMNREKTKQWIAQATLLGFGSDHEENGNIYETRSYAHPDHPGKTFHIEHLNDEPSESYPFKYEEGTKNRLITIQEVVKKTRVIEEIYWDPV